MSIDRALCMFCQWVKGQWRIHDFTYGGARLVGARGGYVSKNLYVETKESGPLGAWAGGAPWIRQKGRMVIFFWELIAWWVSVSYPLLQIMYLYIILLVKDALLHAKYTNTKALKRHYLLVVRSCSYRRFTTCTAHYPIYHPKCATGLNNNCWNPNI